MLDTLDALAVRGREFYQTELGPLLEPQYNGKFVAIEPDTGSHFIGKTGTEALLQARAALPDKLFFLARIGYPTTDTIGGYGARNRQG